MKLIIPTSLVRVSCGWLLFSVLHFICQ